jgi:hypothetical protein
VITLTAAELTRLNAASLLIGGTRTNNADGSTSLAISANTITVENDAAHPLSAPEVILAVDGTGSRIDLQPGAALVATGASNAGGDLQIAGGGANTGQGALLRVANGGQREVDRTSLQTGIGVGRLFVRAGATLSGTSVLLDSSGPISLNPSIRLQASDLAIDAQQIQFASTNAGALTITPALEAKFAALEALTLRSPNAISLASGDYQFSALTLQTPALASMDGGQVVIQAGALGLANPEGTVVDCASLGNCGSGALQLVANQVTFANGVLATPGFGGGVSLAAAGGVYGQGVGGLDSGAADLAIQTPFIGDLASAATAGGQPHVGLTLTTTGALSVSNPGGQKASPGAGAPGSALTLSGRSVAIADATLRATAGDLSITSSTNVSVTGGAVLSVAGYDGSFGDAADPFSVAAPGGRLSLQAAAGDIAVGSGAVLALGGKAGTAGKLSLAASGDLTLGGRIDAAAPTGGASLAVDIGGAFDLTAFASQWGSAFTGDVAVRSGTGDIVLGPGQTWRAASLSLTADGGFVRLAGGLDVSGVNGGDVSLFGAEGVTLASTASILAQARGYSSPGTDPGSAANTDTRQARGGKVAIGTDGDGAIEVDPGAVIDVGALHPYPRVVTLSSSGGSAYTYVPGDAGGDLLLRAPAIEQNGATTVNVSFAGVVKGADSVVLEGFKHYDLGAVADSGAYVGVSRSGGQIVLDLSQTGGQPNFLADDASGTLVDFIQSFDLSAATPRLGMLPALAGFSARPGVQLDYSGDVVLASNWNLGAGAVDVAGAVQAGLMAADPDLPGRYYVLPGADSAIFSNYTTLTYRVGGKVDGAPGALTIRAGGTLDLKGSITDGFFNFRDQTDPGYVSLALGGGAPGTGARVNQAYLAPNCFNGDCTVVDPFDPNVSSPSNFLYFQFPISANPGFQDPLVLGALPFATPIPYSAGANTPWATGELATPTASTGGGDPIGSAALFPLIDRNGNAQAVSSWSYRLVGGAAASANPSQVRSGAGDVVVEGFHPYTLTATAPNPTFAPNLLLQAGNNYDAPSQWLADFESQNSPLSDDAYTSLDWSTAPAAVKAALRADLQAFLAQKTDSTDVVVHGGAPGANTMLTTLGEVDKFLTFLDSAAAPVSFSTLVNGYHPPNSSPFTGAKTVVAPTLVRTGVGSIAIAAGGSIDLRNGATPTLQSANGDTTTANGGGLQLGGVAVYTAGHVVDPANLASVAGQSVASVAGSASVFSNLPAGGYRYGAGSSPSTTGVGFSDIFIADPVFADGGGDVTLTAGLDVLGRRDVMQNARLNANFAAAQSQGYTWIGQGDQPWRTGVVGSTVDIRIDPQLFQEGAATLGGGSVSVTAGRDISDLSVVADTSIATFAAPSSTAPSAGTQGVAVFGGGGVAIDAGARILGGRVDVASGSAMIVATGDIVSAGAIGPASQSTPNDLVLRLTDADVNIAAGGQVQMQGVGALGVRGVASAFQNNLDAMGFYSPAASVSIIADGAVTIENTGLPATSNRGAVLLTPAIDATGGVDVAVYPGSIEAVSLTGALNFQTTGQTPGLVKAASAVIMAPSPFGSLTLAAASDVSSRVAIKATIVTTDLVIQMEDADPFQLPGPFSSFTADPNGGALSGLGFAFNAVYSNTPETTLRLYHDSVPTHADDTVPNRVYAGQDLVDFTLQTPKQTRVGAGRDIVNMMFFGQNLSADDITRIAAGRDITATTELVRPVVALPSVFGAQLPAVQGNSFVIGGPGSFYLEAGRNAGPFLNSATTNAFRVDDGSNSAAGLLTYGNGVRSVGDQWNPWLPLGGADVYTEFGVGKGQDFKGLASAYLDPANLATMPDYLFAQETDLAGNSTPDRSRPIYGPALVSWMQAHEPALLSQLYGSTEVTWQQAYKAFASLPALEQRGFLLKNVYFNELQQTSVPGGVSYLQYARGYTAVNTLFPSRLGYTPNNLGGGSNGASQIVPTGDLDLRLATIQTAQGGDVFILGPGGRVLAGSTVSTADQAARRAFVGGGLVNGGGANGPLASDIASIPVGMEGILTLQDGGIYTFTDKSFLLNQSRLFTEAGGDIVMWSSNADLNAGEGPKTSANFPPIAVTVSQDLFDQIDKDANVSGAGIAAFQPAPGVAAPNVYLIAPRGTVDAGAAGVRVAGNLFIAANAVANADNFKVQGTSFGLPVSGAVNVGAQTSAGSAAAAAAANAQSVAGAAGAQTQRSSISVNILGYDGSGGGGPLACAPDDVRCR